jgi:hypothetical protein
MIVEEPTSNMVCRQFSSPQSIFLTDIAFVGFVIDLEEHVR